MYQTSTANARTEHATIDLFLLTEESLALAKCIVEHLLLLFAGFFLLSLLLCSFLIVGGSIVKLFANATEYAHFYF